MKNSKKNYYIKKNQAVPTVEEFEILNRQYGWTVKEIQKMLRVSAKRALEVFKNVRKRCGSLKYDKHQVKREDVLRYCELLVTPVEHHFVDETTPIPLVEE